jgi:ABC-type sugar transport system ATPase subunit
VSIAAAVHHGAGRADVSSTALLSTVEIHKSFGGVHAVKDVNFSIRAGEIHALVGENGAGKSTLVKMLSGMLEPDAGQVLFEGQPAHLNSARRAQALGIQTIHQELELALPLSIEENVFLGGLPSRYGLVNRDEMRKRTRETLSLLGADLDPATRVGTLRVSDCQLVEIARAMVRKLRVLIMDEPTAALPPVEVGHLFERIRALKAAGIGVVYISHKLDEVLEIADRITIMRDGRIVATMARGDFDRESLVRQILGRELSQLTIAKSATTATPVVACEGLTSAPELDDVSFTVAPGEIVGFFGLLGSGYGAIAEALFGVRPATFRHCRIGDLERCPTDPAEAIAHKIGLVPADRKRDGVFLRLSVRENLLLPSIRQITRFGVLDFAAARRIVQDLVAKFGIRCASDDQNVSELSGGNQQKVALAKWHPAQVNILLLDEPTRGVDVGAKAEIYKLLRDGVGAGMACLIFSSDAEEVAKTCDRAYVLKRGRITVELGGDALDIARLTEAAL